MRSEVKWLTMYKKFLEVQGTYSAVLRNIHGVDKSFEALYAVLALQMLPHAVGFL